MVIDLTTRQRESLEQLRMHSKKVMKCTTEFRFCVLSNWNPFSFYSHFLSSGDRIMCQITACDRRHLHWI